MTATSSTTCTVVAVPASTKEQTKATIDLPTSKKQDYFIESKQSDSDYSSPGKNGDTTKQEPVTGARPLTSFPFAKDTFRFMRDIGQTSIARYKEISPELEKLLKSEFESSGIFSRRRRLRSISTRLVVIGKTEADAKECVVVFCDQPLRKRVTQYLKRDDIIRQLLKPSDPATPSFEIVIKENPPRLRSTSPNVHIHCDSTDLEVTTFCGLSISFTNCDGVSRCGTFGGVVKVIPTEGDAFILGMTAAHTLAELEDSDLDLDEDVELDSISISAEHTERPSSASSSTASLAPQEALVSANCRAFREPFELGKITASSEHDGALDNPYLDWALFDLNEIRPNYLPNSTTQKQIIAASPIASSGHDEFPVLMIGNLQEPKAGCISKVPSRIMIGAGSSFTDALLLTFDGGTVCDGESGAWVVDSATFGVVGHVVATDVLGDAYVIPIQNTLADMQRILGVRSVEIPTALDTSLLSMPKIVSTMDTEEHSQDDSSTTLPNLATWTKQKTTRRKRANSETSRDGDNVQDRGREKMTKTAPSPELRLACPFFKHSPSKCKNFLCAGSGWPSILHLKGHIFYAHKFRGNRCRRCYEVFPSNNDFWDHQRAEIPCFLSHATVSDSGIDEPQFDKLRQMSTETKEETEQWKDIYLIIFPDATDIPSPLHDEDSNCDSNIDCHNMIPLEDGFVAGIRDGFKRQLEQLEDETRIKVAKIVRDTMEDILEQWSDQKNASEASVMPLEAQEACLLPKMPETPKLPERPDPFPLLGFMGDGTSPGGKGRGD